MWRSPIRQLDKSCRLLSRGGDLEEDCDCWLGDDVVEKRVTKSAYSGGRLQVEVGIDSIIGYSVPTPRKQSAWLGGMSVKEGAA